jgi:hypothetical protein
VTKLVLAPENSRVRIRTFAQGLLARLAHDLELVCRDVSGSAERFREGALESEADSGTVSLEIPVAKIDVAGTVKDGRVDPDGLSPSEREDCLAKMCKDVFHTTPGSNAVVRVDGKLDGGKARIRVSPPNGRAIEQALTVRVDPAGERGVRIAGSFEMSLASIGSDPVKGPMNAFRVKDSVELVFELVFAEAG